MSTDTTDIPELATPGEEETQDQTLGSQLDIGSQGDLEQEGEAPVERPAPAIRGKVDRFGVAWGTGRRKTSVARVRVKDGTGQFKVNGRPLEEYFLIERDRHMVMAPVSATEMLGRIDVEATVSGGGPTGQTGAVILGIARALEAKNPALHSKLSEGGFLTRDGRMVERKKYGYKKARRSFQFSKR